MALFGRNPNEINYVGGKKHWTDVIKNTGDGNLLIWLNGEEDFNTNSTLIVAESEEALFFKDGVIQETFTGGRYQLSTENYPFISRLRNAFSGGISTFNCKVYFVRKAHSLELLWGTDTPIQVRDPKWNLATSVRARGSYSIQVDDAKKFLLKLVGNNVQAFTKEEITIYFRSAFLQYIKSGIARVIRESNEEILGLCAEQDVIAERLKLILDEIMDEYGIRLVNFYISSIDIPENDPNRQKLEEAYANMGMLGIMGDQYTRIKGMEILQDLANNPGAGGVAAAGAGVGMGMAAGGVFSAMAQQVFSPIHQQVQAVEQQPAQQQRQVSRFVQKSAAPASAGNKCPSCGAENQAGAKFCNECGTKMSPAKKFCTNCGAEVPGTVKFCNECGNRIE